MFEVELLAGLVLFRHTVTMIETLPPYASTGGPVVQKTTFQGVPGSQLLPH